MSLKVPTDRSISVGDLKRYEAARMGSQRLGAAIDQLLKRMKRGDGG